MGYVILSSGIDSSRFVTGGSEVKLGDIAVQITSASPVLARIDASIRSSILERMYVARVRTGTWEESRRIRIGGRIRCKFAWMVDFYYQYGEWAKKDTSR